MRRDASDSPSPRVPHSESISSMKMIDGACSRAIANNCLTSLCVADHRRCGQHLVVRPRKLGKKSTTSRGCYAPFTLTHPLADQVRRTDAEEGTLGLCGDCLGEETLSSPGRTVQEDAAPRCPLAGKEVRELDREDDGFFQGLLGLFETGNVFPPDVGRLGQDGAWRGKARCG